MKKRMHWILGNGWGCLLLWGWAHLALAQPTPSGKAARAQLEQARTDYLTAQMDLSPAQADRFWPLYDEFADRRRDILRQLRPLRRPVGDALTEAEAKAQLRRWHELRAQEVALSTEYTDRFLEVLTARQVRQLYAAERAFSSEVLRQVRTRRGGIPPRRPPPDE